jgi:hypothetical protein
MTDDGSGIRIFGCVAAEHVVFGIILAGETAIADIRGDANDGVVGSIGTWAHTLADGVLAGEEATGEEPAENHFVFGGRTVGFLEAVYANKLREDGRQWT